MEQEPELPAGGVANTVTGDISGVLIQARQIEGGVHVHHSARPTVNLPYRAGLVPLRAGAFQDRSAVRVSNDAVNAGDSVVLTSEGPARASVLSAAK